MSEASVATAAYFLTVKKNPALGFELLKLDSFHQGQDGVEVDFP